MPLRKQLRTKNEMKYDYGERTVIEDLLVGVQNKPFGR